MDLLSLMHVLARVMRGDGILCQLYTLRTSGCAVLDVNMEHGEPDGWGVQHLGSSGNSIDSKVIKYSFYI